MNKRKQEKKKKLLIGLSKEAFIQNILLCLVCLLLDIW